MASRLGREPLVRLSLYSSIPESDKPEDANISGEYIINNRRFCIQFAPFHTETRLTFEYPQHHYILLAPMKSDEEMDISAKTVFLLSRIEAAKEIVIKSSKVVTFFPLPDNVKIDPPEALIQISNADIRPMINVFSLIQNSNPDLRRIFYMIMDLWVMQEPASSSMTFIDLFHFFSIKAPSDLELDITNHKLISAYYSIKMKPVDHELRSQMLAHFDKCDQCKNLENSLGPLSQLHVRINVLKQFIGTLVGEKEHQKTSGKYLEAIGALEYNYLGKPIYDYPDFYTKEELVKILEDETANFESLISSPN